jgi:DNA (cytosine-5)-methyltransferase 1
MYIYADGISPTYTSNSDVIYLFDEYRKPNKFESCCIGSYPLDYNFHKVQYNYLIGMSVPPVMMAQIAKQVYEQWLSKL